MGGQTDEQTKRWAVGQIDSWAEGQTDRETDTNLNV